MSIKDHLTYGTRIIPIAVKSTYYKFTKQPKKLIETIEQEINLLNSNPSIPNEHYSIEKIRCLKREKSELEMKL